MPILAVIGAMCLLAAAGAVASCPADLGIFDKMLLRASSDKAAHWHALQRSTCSTTSIGMSFCWGPTRCG